MKEWTARTFALHQSSLAAGSLSATCEGRALGSPEGPRCAAQSAGPKICARCGTALGARCAKCGAENSLTSNFCGKYGAALTALFSTPISERATILSREVIGERRHLTVLFCDLVGSTAIAAQLDPEEWRDTVAGYHSATAEAITRFGGHVAKISRRRAMAYLLRLA
jgi:hypothetical protein